MVTQVHVKSQASFVRQALSLPASVLVSCLAEASLEADHKQEERAKENAHP